ncbi:MAG: hypothetical protein MZU91_12945 [Desulfosudis oleivorans]|nr:hypothetical protein [Desulfosudis oleivorans]
MLEVRTVFPSNWGGRTSTSTASRYTRCGPSQLRRSNWLWLSHRLLLHGRRCRQDPPALARWRLLGRPRVT